jgi:hypothetical protein
MKDYTSTTSPNHAAGGFSQDCAACHNELTWAHTDFDHNQTGFPLTNAHAALTCERCHTGGVFTGLSTDCVSCHRQDYDGTTSPRHGPAGFSEDCTQCHTTRGWTGADFNHAGTGFPLTGAHKPLACDQCHTGTIYSGLSPACISCHQSDFDGTTNPNHAAARFPEDCTPCHTTQRWTPASFNHNATAFPLTGAHTTVACDQCHAGGVYTGTPTACVSCHRSDFDGTADPNHAAAAFSTDCTLCHTTQRWTGATFDHNQWFPIYSGRHAKGTWQTCDDCHTNAASYADFSCLGCHPHSDKNKTDGNHSGVRNYSYDSAACYNCHPNGRVR